jgi:hypothetical protein
MLTWSFPKSFFTEFGRYDSSTVLQDNVIIEAENVPLKKFLLFDCFLKF